MRARLSRPAVRRRTDVEGDGPQGRRCGREEGQGLMDQRKRDASTRLQWAREDAAKERAARQREREEAARIKQAREDAERRQRDEMLRKIAQSAKDARRAVRGH